MMKILQFKLGARMQQELPFDGEENAEEESSLFEDDEEETEDEQQDRRSELHIVEHGSVE
jgi:hypothetical protein